MSTADIIGVTAYAFLLALVVSGLFILQTEEINERFDRIEAAIAEQATAAETGSEENGGKP